LLVRFARFVLVFVSLVLLVSALPARAQPADGSAAGVVVDQVNGLPLSAATIALYRGDASIASAKSDAHGAFTFDAVPPGLYTISISATGYQTSRSREFSVSAGVQTTVDIAVNRATESQANDNVKTIGSVTVAATSPLVSTTTITNSIDPATVQQENFIGFGLALARLPGVNSTGLSSSVSDDQYLDIRGLGPSETQTLLDGHPVGPQGVYAINGGGSYPYGFNFSDSPIFGLSKVTVTFGSGATGLYGVDAIGGTIDLQTLNPSLQPTEHFWQSIGDQGRMQTAADATGTIGRLSYALAGGVLGTYGMFAPALITQTGRPNNNENANNRGACTAGNDISACNTALNTYLVSQNSTLRATLAKLRYHLSNNTTITTTLYSSGQESDSTGNGDNDNIPYDTRLAQIQSNPGNCALPGAKPGTMNGYQVITVANAKNNPTACYTAQQWALASYGPYGGGADRNRGAMMTDYNVNLQSISGNNTFIADGYFNHYKFYKSSEEASGIDSSGDFTGTQYSQFLNSQGYLLADDLQGRKSDLGIGFFGEYQLDTRLDYNTNGQGIYSYENPESTHYTSAFLRSSYEFNNALSAYGNFWVKKDSVIGDTNFDPRVSLVVRPEAGDVFRVTYGHSTGDPAAELKFAGPPQINGNPSSLNPSCTPYNSIGSGGNPGILPESANDYEVGYAHRLARDSSISVNMYYTAVQNQLFAANEPLSQYGSLPISPTVLQGYANKIASIGCPGVNVADPATVLPYLAISNTYNAASSVSKGIELSGRQRVSRHVYFDYSYDIQSVVQNGINENILQNNPFVISGGQLQGIPINQATAGLDYANQGLEVRMDGYVVGNNNPSSRPAYNTWNGFISKALPNNYTLTFGVQNVFNEAWQNYGYFGHEPLIPENHYFSDTNSIQQYLNTGSNEEFGIPIRSFLITLSGRL
jgi:outer membrane receptor protein involved in Fe transport